MRKIAAPPRPPRRVQDNPRVFGEDLTSLAVKGLGAGFTAAVHDSVVSPLTKSVVSGWNTADNLMAKVVDGVTTGAAAWLGGKVVGMVAGSRWGDEVLEGGMILAVARVVAGVIPGYSLNASFPTIPGLSQIGLNAAPPPALPAASNGNSTPSSQPPAQVGSVRMIAI